MLFGSIGFTLVYTFLLRKYDFRRQWSATLKNRGQSKNTHELTGVKNGGSSLAVGIYLQRGSAPPPPWGVKEVGGGGQQGEMDGRSAYVVASYVRIVSTDRDLTLQLLKTDQLYLYYWRLGGGGGQLHVRIDN